MPSTLTRPVSYGPSSAADPAQGRRYGGAFWMSALMHGLVVALVFLLTVALRDRTKPEVQAFEIVAGAGDNYQATEAPSGSEAGLAEMGELFTPRGEVPTWTPPAPEPELPTPVTPVAPLPPEPAKPVVATPPVPNFKNQINRKLQQEKRKTDKEIQQQRADDARAAKERELADKRLSYAEYQKSLGNKTSPSQKAPAAGAAAASGPRIDANSIRKGVTGGTGAGSKGAGSTALTAAEGAAMQRYDSMLKQRLREAHEKPGGLSDLLTADVQFTMAANGSFSGVRIVRSSGNADFDQSVLEAFGRVRMPPRPDGKTEVITLTFRMKEI